MVSVTSRHPCAYAKNYVVDFKADTYFAIPKSSCLQQPIKSLTNIFARFCPLPFFRPALQPIEPVALHPAHRQRASAMAHHDGVALLTRLLACPAGQLIERHTETFPLGHLTERRGQRARDSSCLSSSSLPIWIQPVLVWRMPYSQDGCQAP